MGIDIYATKIIYVCLKSLGLHSGPALHLCLDLGPKAEIALSSRLLTTVAKLHEMQLNMYASVCNERRSLLGILSYSGVPILQMQ